ncbi:MAG: choice-of-anchor B family protein, partial [Gracilimonas sp.]|nr:choice-of-anchor B family protein [Gracilimonas sp.]
MRFYSYVIPILLMSLISAPIFAQTTADGEAEAMQGFARAVDIYDGTVFIGEPANYHQSGIVYVYSKDGKDWTELTQLQASDGEIGNNFGSVLSANENRILIGAPGTNNDSGAAYFFTLDEWEWVESASLSHGAEEAGFGSSVVLKGDHAFIGAPSHNEIGAVLVFRNENGNWNELTTIANPDTSGSGFGSSISVDGNIVVVGAPARDGGTVYVYENTDSDFNLKTTLNSRQVDERSRFGAVVKVKENQIFVSAPRNDAASGAVIEFTKDGKSGEWVENSRLVAFDSQMRYLFGSAIAFSEDEVWIGAPNADGGNGVIYQFTQNGDGIWNSVTKMISEESDGDRFAGTMAVENNIAVVGLTGADFGAGSASILEKDEAGIWTTKEILIGEGDNVLEPITGERVDCENGKADFYLCDNVDLISFLPIRDIGGERGVRLNDMWGWTDQETGKNYAIVGRNNGTSFVDVTDPFNPIYIGDLPLTETAQPNVWRDMKVYKDHVYIVADGAREHGMQVLDLTELRDFDGEPMLFEETTIYRNVNSVHNIVINEDTGFAYAVGSGGGGETCGGGLHMINIQDPANPKFEGCFADPSTGRSGTGYS